MNNRQQILAEYLKTNPESLKAGYRNDIFEYNNEEYLILTDKEATQEATEEIMQSLWAFRASWIRTFIEDRDLQLNDVQEVTLDNLEFYQEEMCEDANSLIEELISGYEGEFVEDAIEADKRGHFISRYDGLEIDFNGYFIYRTN